MRTVALLLISLLLPASVGAPCAKARASISTKPDQSLPSDNRIRLAQGQLPSIDRPAPAASRDIASATRSHGHFYFNTEVNGVAVPMMFDTGASAVLLRAEDAERVGINVSSLNFSLHPTTANGIGSAAPVVIKVLKVGNITRNNVVGAVAKPGSLSINLLGQTFMTTLAGFSTEGDTLTLHGD